MVNDGEDLHGLQTMNLKTLGFTFQDAQTMKCPMLLTSIVLKSLSSIIRYQNLPKQTTTNWWYPINKPLL